MTLTPFTNRSHAVELADARLGDVVVLPDGRSLTVRARIDPPAPMSGITTAFIVGEMDAILTVREGNAETVGYLVPVPGLQAGTVVRAVAAQGVTRYWAPHLPPLPQAMADLQFKVLDVQGSVVPVVVLFRSTEVIPFAQASEILTRRLQVMTLAGQEESADVQRRSWVVMQTPTTSPATLEEVRASLS